jgi:hypothetical protein
MPAPAGKNKSLRYMLVPFDTKRDGSIRKRIRAAKILPPAWSSAHRTIAAHPSERDRGRRTRCSRRIYVCIGAIGADGNRAAYRAPAPALDGSGRIAIQALLPGRHSSGTSVPFVRPVAAEHAGDA